MAEALSTCLEAIAGEKTQKKTAIKINRKPGWIAALAGCALAAAIGLFWFQTSQKVPEKPPATSYTPRPGPDAPEPAVKTGSGAGADTRPPADVQPGPLSALNVSSNPSNAQVFLDGSFKGDTPLKLDLPPGKYEVRVSLADHYEYEAQVQLKDPGELPLFVRLIPMK